MSLPSISKRTPKSGRKNTGVSSPNKRASSESRNHVIHTAEGMIKQMPISYLKSKPELKKYVCEIGCERIFTCLDSLYARIIAKAFHQWKTPLVVQINEKQFGIIVICKVFVNIVDHILQRHFQRWALLYSSKYNPTPQTAAIIAVIQIQRWYRYCISESRRLRKAWYNAVKVLSQRNIAIKHFLSFEKLRVKSLQKIRLGVSFRRRYYLGGRTIQRVWRWNKRRIRVTRRLTRAFHARMIRHWWRRIRERGETFHAIIGVVRRCGGYYRFYSRIPIRCMRLGYLDSVSAAVSIIQKAWFTSLGKFSLYLRIAASRERRAQELIEYRAAKVLQNAYLAKVWRTLMSSLKTYNRARRIHRGLRAYGLRLAIFKRILARKYRCAAQIAQFYRRRRGIKYLYKLIDIRRRRAALEIYSVCRIQYLYRCFVVRRRFRRHRNKKYYALLRGKSTIVRQSASYIQKNWRISTGRFPHHIYMLMSRLAQEMAIEKANAATLLQAWIRTRMPYQRRKRALALLALQNKKSRIIQKLAKSYLLRKELQRRVFATYRKKVGAAATIGRNIRLRIWRKRMDVKFVRMAEVLSRLREEFAAATMIQRGLSRKHREYNQPLRIAARIQLQRRRELLALETERQRQKDAKAKIDRFLSHCFGWTRTIAKLARIKNKFIRDRAIKRLRRCNTFVQSAVRFHSNLAIRKERLFQEEKARVEARALATIGFFVRRRKELKGLDIRFELRKKILKVVHDLEDERNIAEESRLAAEEEVRRSEENMKATIDASWKQGSDATGRNYYYNYVTGESRWTPPDEWKIKPADQWVRNVDERGNVYYYNIKTGKSRWLPPCSVCGKKAEKFCLECGVSYCDKHFTSVHIEGEDSTLASHTWSLTEIEREPLQSGQVYCVECNKRAAVDMCTTCWDAYCEECFKFTHKSGNLRKHRTIEYKRAKKGWMCIKAREEGEMDYYINGTTGATTYEKPIQLMTPQEKVYFQNFQVHEEAAKKYVKDIERLQIELETASYERDKIMFEALTNAPKKSEQGAVAALAADGTSVKGFAGGDRSEYRKFLLQPTTRRRGKDRSDYIKGLLESVVEGKSPPPT